ncbi:MAG: amidophosphoribosyltransferase [Actinobacteria bacterium]|nr:amidophosphoribosyltransferase [Thermoleophilia bacterium]MCB9011405.1 amidophosphoribosyltransferase [Actinomycetota bacterium]
MSDVFDGHLHEECGVAGVVASGRDVSRLMFFALHALQHRGQESAGIAVNDDGHVMVQRDLGLVSAVFDEPSLQSLRGAAAIGHVRYSTTGANRWANAQPVTRNRGDGMVALGHNGNLTNTDALRAELSGDPEPLVATNDSELIAALVAREPGSLLDAVAAVMPKLVGAFSVVALSHRELVAFRDANGVRPLVIGTFDGDGYCVASETAALDQIGATPVRDVRPGEAIRLRENGFDSIQALEPGEPRLCVFESIYFARPDSVLEGSTVWGQRRAMGAELAREHPAEADLVVGLPDSGTPAAIGFAEASGIPYAEAVVRNRYVGRSFIQPDQDLRRNGVKLKFNPLREVIAGKRLVVVDDSIVRGTTTGQVVAMLREAGAREVHMRISSPPLRWPCFYGIDMPNRHELVASSHSVEEIAAMTGATSLAYLGLDALQRALGQPSDRFCRACFTGEYPIPVPDSTMKLRFESPVRA